MTLASCKKIPEDKNPTKGDADVDCQGGEASQQANNSNKKTPKMKVRRSGVRRGTVDSCNGAEEFQLLGLRAESKKQRYEYD